ncbi:MAG: DUF655 domain-containing protein [Nitrososphaerales archaeon]
MSTSLLPKKYEEFAFVLDSIPHGRSMIIRGREGPIVQAIGEDRLTLLEILALADSTFEIGERIGIGKQDRVKVMSVLGKLSHDELTTDAKDDLSIVVEKLVIANESRFVAYFNEAQPVTPRLHALEVIPGIGKTFMMQILREREKKPFDSLDDLQKRVGVREPAKLITRRILEEIAGGSRISLFVQR